LLDQEQRAKLEEVAANFSSDGPSQTLSIDATQGGEVRETEVTQDVKEEKPSLKEEEHVEAAPQEASQEETDNSPPPEPKGHKVPYSRFKNVLDARNQFQKQTTEYQTKVSSLEEKLQALQSQVGTPAPTPQVKSQGHDWLDDYLGIDTAQETAPEWQSQYNTLHDRLYKFEVAQEEKNLRVELGSLKETFPSVPENYLLQAVINDPSVNLASKAEEYHTFISAIGEHAIAQYLEDNPGESIAPTPEVPKRGSHGGSAPAREHVFPSRKPKSIGDATSALRDALGKHNPFKD
jgi:hypothetical protein